MYPTPPPTLSPPETITKTMLLECRSRVNGRRAYG